MIAQFKTIKNNGRQAPFQELFTSMVMSRAASF